MDKTVFNLALTGHRPTKLDGYKLNSPFYDALKETLLDLIVKASNNYDIVRCHTGMALGADTIWGLAILQAQKMNLPATITLVAHIPFLQQPDAWFVQADKDRWQMLRDNATSEVVYGDLGDLTGNDRKYRAIKLLDERNIGMVDACDGIIAVWDGSRGGTANAHNYAKKVGKFIHIIKPEEIRGGM